MKIKELQKKDWGKVIQCAIKGMHFDEYLKSKFLLKAYGRYFWYLEYMKGEPKPNKSFWKGVYIKFVDIIQKLFFGGGVMSYNEANKAMYEKYTEQYTPDGEIRFLAADPESKVKGVGTFLLNELTKREQSKEIYLFTDTNCTYQFYEKRGFERIGEKEIVLGLSEDVDLKCLLYRKQL